MNRRFDLPVLLFAIVFAPLAQAQLAPVVGSRGVVNAYTQEPAPSSVAPGGLIWISGLNFGSAADTQVLVNGAEARVLSAGAGRIVAQLPPDTAPGLAEVVVQRGSARSRAARVLVELVVPSVRALNDGGYGEAAATVSGEIATLTASGFGQDATAAGPVIAHVGGLPAATEVTARDGRPGEFDVKVSLPAGWQSGDVISLRAGPRAANRTTMRKAARPEVNFVRLPSDAPELRTLAGSDLRGNYLVASGARDSAGCYPSYLFDSARNSMARIDSCLVGGNPGGTQGGNQGTAPGGAQGVVQPDISPVTAESEGAGLAALVGPAEGQAPAGVSSKVLVFHPERANPLTVQLPSAATSLVAAGAEGITAMLAGDAPKRVTIDTRTGEVREAPGAGFPAAAGGAGLPGAAGFGLGVDLGDGMNQVLSAFATASDGSIGVVVGDNADKPTRMKFAIVDAQGEVTSQAFPDNWQALFGPAASVPAMGGAPGGGGPVPGASAMRATVVAHPASKEFYVLSRNSSNSAHALVAFAKAGSGARLVRFPDGWFAAACTARVPLYTFQLSSSIAVPASQTLETEAKSPCLARGLVVAEPGADRATSISFPAQAPLNLAGSTGTMNDFVYGGNAASPDILVVFDGAMGAVSQSSLPPGVSSFSGLIQVASMNALIAVGTKQSQGDAGFVFFDLERGDASTLSLPDRFSSASVVGVFPVTRKLVATGTRSDGTGSQLIVHDLVSGDATVIPNPEGVAWIGSVTQQTTVGLPGGGFFPGGAPPGGAPGMVLASAGLQQANTKANTVAAVCFDPNRKQAGVTAVRVP
ncbi:MAG: IPT/TIG domain-containing protein [Acidobacteria bacterium]|nr:IPT/TIG domain-containing protein [Acidobacteriota bacterium]